MCAEPSKKKRSTSVLIGVKEPLSLRNPKVLSSVSTNALLPTTAKDEILLLKNNFGSLSENARKNSFLVE